MTTSLDLNLWATSLWLTDDIELRAEKCVDVSFPVTVAQNDAADVARLIDGLWEGVGDLLPLRGAMLDNEQFRQWWPISNAELGSLKDDEKLTAEAFV